MTKPQTTFTSGPLDNKRLDARYVRRLISDPGGGYTATIHELPGCIAEGDTAEEALKNLELSAQSWIESAKENGYPVTEPIDYEGYSGKIALRISRRLHQISAERAELEGVSLNQFIGNALSCYIGQQDGMKRLADHFENALANGMRAFYAQVTSATVVREASSSRTAMRKSQSMIFYQPGPEGMLLNSIDGNNEIKLKI